MAKVGRIIWTVLLTIATISSGNAARQERLLRGRDAGPGEFPYTVSLVLKGYHHLCGGTIITPRHILTAAHCFVGLSKPPYTRGLTVLTGATNRTGEGEVHRVLRVTPHSDFESGSAARWRNDIAIVTLADEIRATQLQSPIALPKSRTPGDVTGVLSGWGYTWMNGNVTEVLKTRRVRILTNEACNAQNVRINEKQLCGFDGHATGFCTGDSGGPLVYDGAVVGVVSFSAACGIGAPDVYTRVDGYLDFINGITSSDSL